MVFDTNQHTHRHTRQIKSHLKPHLFRVFNWSYHTRPKNICLWIAMHLIDFLILPCNNTDSTTFLSVRLQCISSLPNRILKRSSMESIERWEHLNIYVCMFFHIHENGLAFFKELNQKNIYLELAWGPPIRNARKMEKGKRVSLVIWCGFFIFT